MRLLTSVSQKKREKKAENECWTQNVLGLLLITQEEFEEEAMSEIGERNVWKISPECLFKKSSEKSRVRLCKTNLNKAHTGTYTRNITHKQSITPFRHLLRSKLSHLVRGPKLEQEAPKQRSENKADTMTHCALCSGGSEKAWDQQRCLFFYSPKVERSPYLSCWLPCLISWFWLTPANLLYMCAICSTASLCFNR